VDAAMPAVRRMGRDRVDRRMSLLLVAGLLAATWFSHGVLLPGIDPHAAADFQKLSIVWMGSSLLHQPLWGMSIGAIGTGPYVIAAVVLQLLAVLVRQIGTSAVREVTSARIDRAVLVATVAIAIVQAWFLATYLERSQQPTGPLVSSPGWRFRFEAICALVAGTMLLVTIARVVTAIARVNGIAVLLAFEAVGGIAQGARWLTSADAPLLPYIASLALGVGLAAFLLRFRRRIPLRDARGRSGVPALAMTLGPGGGTALSVGAMLLAGVSMSALLTRSSGISNFLSVTQAPYLSTLAALCVGLAIALPALFQVPARTGEGLREAGLCFPGVRPGADTEAYARTLWRRLMPGSAAVLVGLAIGVPILLEAAGVLRPGQMPVRGASLLLLVAVWLDGRLALRGATTVTVPSAGTPPGAAAEAGGRCPACSSEVADGFAVCWSCGGPVAPISPLPTPPALPEPPPEGGAPVTVARLVFPIDAEIARLKLEAQGIPVRLLDYHIVLANWFLGVAVGGIRVQVPEECAPAARELLFPPEPTVRGR